MRNFKTLGLALALSSASLMGCVDGGQDSLTVNGTYYVESSLKTPQGIPEQDAFELTELSKLAGHPELVSTWLLERMEDQLDGTQRELLGFARQGNDVDGQFQEFLEEEAPEFVTALTGIAQDVVDLTSSIDLLSELELTVSDEDEQLGTYKHSFTGIVYRVGGQEYRYDFADMDVEAPEAIRGQFRMYDDDERWGRTDIISFDSSAFDMEYGKSLDYALQNIVVERTDPYADNFSELVTSYVPCKNAGDWIADELDFGPSAIYGTACAGAFDKLSEKLLPSSMKEMQVEVRLDGDALLTEDEDGDRRVDAFADGEWEGSIAYPSLTVTLRRPQHTFTATRRRGIRNNNDDVGR